MTLTDEEQRYAAAWAKLRCQAKFARWVMAALVLAMVSLLLAPKSFGDSFGIPFLVLAVVAGLSGWITTIRFKCPRCHRQFSSMNRQQPKTGRYHCGLPRFAPRNPDPNWKLNGVRA